MSIYATNYIIDETIGEAILLKHLNKRRVDRGSWNLYSNAKGWNKSGKRNRMKDTANKGNDAYLDSCIKPIVSHKRYKQKPTIEQLMTDYN